MYARKKTPIYRSACGNRKLGHNALIRFKTICDGRVSERFDLEMRVNAVNKMYIQLRWFICRVN